MINKIVKLRTGNVVIILDKIIDSHNSVSVTKYFVKKINGSEVFLVLPSEIIKIVNISTDE